MSIEKSDLSRVAPATLLLSLSVMYNFLEILQKFKKNSFQYSKQLSIIVFQAYKSGRYASGWGVIYSCF